LMEASPPGKVFVSAAVVAAAGGRERFEHRGALTVKGRDEPVAVFEAIRQDHARGLRRQRAAIIGRERERRVLQEHVLALKARQAAGLLLVEGDPGIGKSCLIDELTDIAAGAEVKLAAGAASSIERSTAYYMWRSALADALSAGPGTSLRERVLEEVSDDADLTRWCPLLNGFLPLDLPENE